MRKPVILVAVGENTEWTKSNMGILVVDEVKKMVALICKGYFKINILLPVLMKKVF